MYAIAFGLLACYDTNNVIHQIVYNEEDMNCQLQTIFQLGLQKKQRICILMRFFLYEIYLKAMSGTEYPEVTDCYWGLCS